MKVFWPAVVGSFPGCTVYGMDGSTNMLDAARERLADFGDRFQPLPFDLLVRLAKTVLPCSCRSVFLPYTPQ